MIPSTPAVTGYAQALLIHAGATCERFTLGLTASASPFSPWSFSGSVAYAHRNLLVTHYVQPRNKPKLTLVWSPCPPERSRKVPLPWSSQASDSGKHSTGLSEGAGDGHTTNAVFLFLFFTCLLPCPSHLLPVITFSNKNLCLKFCVQGTKAKAFQNLCVQSAFLNFHWEPLRLECKRMSYFNKLAWFSQEKCIFLYIAEHVGHIQYEKSLQIVVCLSVCLYSPCLGTVCAIRWRDPLLGHWGGAHQSWFRVRWKLKANYQRK